MSIPGLSEWLKSPLGSYLLEWEQAKCDQAVADIFGFKAVQLGLCEEDYLRANRIPFRFCCDEPPAGGVAARLGFHALPFASTSVDLVVLPHVLEFSAFPHQVLREVERILVPEGQLVVTGFNPLSLWGLRRRFASCPPAGPWQGEYLSLRRLKDWLKLLGFEIQGGNFGCYAPPLAEALSRWRWMDKAGDRWWPVMGGAYLLQAVKRTPGMRVIMPRRREILARTPGLTPVVQKTDIFQ